ncbi:MAG TPA: hypothetical protein VK427_23005, partial [Kofleriaceae bacterium]|nr:hypothetical protein [Kofleriaceae bacterium]
MALEGAVSTREPHASLPRELATGVALFAVHASAITESVVRGCTPTATVLVAGMALITIGVALRISAIGVLGGA